MQAGIKGGLMCDNKLVRLTNGHPIFWCPVISVHFQVTRMAQQTLWFLL